MLLSHPAFDVDGVTVPMGCVVASGMVSGRIMGAFNELRDGMACDALLDATNQGLTGKDITPVLNQWRNAHGLTSAELTERWLTAYGLEVSDLATYISRRIAVERVGAHIDTARQQTPAPLPAAIAGLLDHLLFTDRLTDLVQDVAQRAAVDTALEPHQVEREQRAVLESLAEVGGIEGVSQLFQLTPEQGQLVLGMEARFRLADREVCSAELLQRELRRSRRGLTRVEYAQAVFPQEGIALEVSASLREDRQMWLEQLAHQLSVEPTRHERFVDDLNDSATATRLATGQVGDVIGPERLGAGFVVSEVLSRREPVLDDPDILARVQRVLRRRAFSSAVERRIRFHFT